MARPQANVPAATYRLQLNREQTFADARALVDYLDALGITHLYVSPVSQARPGSAHGYDVVDPTRVNAELGGRRGLERLAAALRSRGMGLVIDTVPNHMAVAPENRWWQDVVRRGRASPYARFFDIDWRRSEGGDLVYRRFFNIDDLAGVRVEDAEVFDATQRLAIELARDGIASGLRIDHIDGLRDPLAYLRKLRRRAGAQTFLVVEKVLTGDEPLPKDWPVAGTTGYDFMNIVNGLFVNRGGLQKLDETYRRLTRDDASLPEVTYESKRYVLRELFAREMDALAHELCVLARHDAPSLRLAQEEAREAIEEVIAALGAYRTYTRDATVAERDRRYIERALRRARRRSERVRGATFAFLRRVLLLRIDAARRRSDWLRFVMRWQQYTGPATAKGLEDTALYRYNRLISLSEVGADPEAPGPLSIPRFHEAMRDRLARWPHTMNATATHDTKRGEDARMRIDALSELPDEWSRLVRRWSRTNRALKQRVEGRVVPDANEELLIYQALAGAWPA
ncbi:MAG: alpha-amylase family glycosyl hydrolase, partial [Dehalococcoidia bacterium]